MKKNETIIESDPGRMYTIQSLGLESDPGPMYTIQSLGPFDKAYKTMALAYF